ncbi:Carboxypeptidase N subunit 2 [Holothuria leucospilota]|uniref:Carboxypeptidase N subunit 2 n=1 Tax=Holothuria leucospilota TaxID=206669 RepID=A0A9Q0YGJ5_HOLLE|nr:Carboxypeptidase N subunit 2 [Holothuria leucospilota]
MTTKYRSFLYLFLAAVTLLCTASIDNAQRDTNEVPSSDCGQLCPCRCKRREMVFDCRNGAQAVSSLDEITNGSCGELSDFTNFKFSNNSFQKFTNFVTNGAQMMFGYVIAGSCSLDLSHNELTQVENLRFHDCRHIYIDFSYNYLTSLPLNIFVNIRTLISEPSSRLQLEFNFSHNRITSLRDFINIKVYVVHFYNIDFIIDLSFNQIFISSLPDCLFLIPSVTHLVINKVTVLMQNNRISSLESYLDGLGPLDVRNIVLDLRQNRLSSLPPASSTTETHSLSLSLEGNPWNCDCHQRWIADSTSKLRKILSNQDSTQPYCKHPKNVKGRPLLNLTHAEFVCPPEIDQTVDTDYRPSAGGTVELMCPLVGGDPPIRNIEWKIWPKTGFLKSFWSVKVCANCSLVISDMDHNLEGIYQCTADNGIKVSSDLINLSISWSQEFITTTIDPDFIDSVKRVPHLTWPIIILLLLLVIVSFGLILISCNFYRVYQKDDSRGTYRDSSTNLIGSYEIPSPPVIFSTPEESVDLLRGYEYQEPFNDETDMYGLYEDVSYQRVSEEARTRDIQSNKDGKVPNTETVRHHKSGLNSLCYNIKRSSDPKGAAKSGTPDDDDYEVTYDEEYTSLNVVNEYESQVSYQPLNFPQRASLR